MTLIERLRKHYYVSGTTDTEALVDEAVNRIAQLESELALLSDKACAAVLVYRTALAKLTDSFKYSTEVVTIARNALAQSTEFTKETSVKPTENRCACHGLVTGACPFDAPAPKTKGDAT